MNSLWVVGAILALIVGSVFTANIHYAESQSQTTNMTQSTNVIDSIQSQNENRSLIESVINITNHTNPIGASVQQMIQATSMGNATSTNPPSSVKPSPSRINWGQLCRNSLVDSLITEPCETLTTPDGYALTSEGQRVFLVCIAGGTLATFLGYPEVTAVAKCGETGSHNNNETVTNTLKDLISNDTN